MRACAWSASGWAHLLWDSLPGGGPSLCLVQQGSSWDASGHAHGRILLFLPSTPSFASCSKAAVNELRLLASLHHPHVVQYHGGFVDVSGDPTLCC